MTKQTHEDFVLALLERAGRRGMKTFGVNRCGLDNYITSADRTLRRLQHDGKIIGRKRVGEKVKTWWTIQNYDLLSEQKDRQDEWPEKREGDEK